MRLLIPLFLLLSSVNTAWSQPGSGWQWTSASSLASQSPGRMVQDIHTDAAGNVYVIGYFMGNMTIGVYTISTTGDGTVSANFDQDAFIAKYDANGNIQWLKRYGVAAVAANDRGQVINVDAGGNVYAGMGYGTPDLVKYDANGNLLWKKTLNLYEIGGINISQDGNLIVMTSTQNAKNIFKLDKADGNIIWQVNNTNAGSNSGTTYQDFIDAQGNIYYTCFAAAAVTATIAGQSFTTPGLATFIASLDNNGNRRWVQQMDNVQVQLSYTVDKNGKSYIQIGGGFGGTFQGISTASPLGNRYFELDNQGIVSRYALLSPYKGLFRVKDDGIYGYVVETGGTARTVAYGDYYTAIPALNTRSIGIIIKYDASSDQVVWTNSFEMNGQAYTAGSIATIETGPGSKVQVGGAFGATSAFGALTNTSTIGGGYGQTDFYLSQFDGANVAAPAVATWTGAAGNTSWSDAGNWSNKVPDAATKVVIPAGAPLYPQGITAANLVAKLEIASGVSIGLPIGFAAPGGIVNMGSIEVTGAGSFSGFNSNTSPLTGNGKLVFTANSPSSIFLGNLPGSLEINKPGGSISYSGGNIAGSLYLTNGMLSVSPYDAVLTDPAATVTYSPGSYINYGRLKRAVSASGTYVFPVGSSNSYAPVILELDALSGPQFITTGFTAGTNITPNLNINGSVVSSLLNAGRWTITPDAAVSSGNYDITLESRTSTNGVTDAARYVVLKRAGDNSNWGFDGKKSSSSQTGGTTSGSVVSNATVAMVQENLDSFGDFAIGVGSAAIANATETNTSQWSGAAGNSLWTDAGNWNNGVPTSLTKAVIPAGATSYPQNITAANATGKLEVEAGAEIKLPSSFLAPSGIVNNGSIEVTGTGSLRGFGNATNGYASLNGAGKLVFRATGITGISAQGAAQVINQNVEIINVPVFSTNNPFINGSVTLTGSIMQGFTITDPDAVFTYTNDSYVTGTITLAVKPDGVYNFPFVNGVVQVSLSNAVGPQSLSVYSSLLTTTGTAPNFTALGQPVNKLLNGGIYTVTPNVALTAGAYNITINEKGATNMVPEASKYIIIKRANSSGIWAFTGDNGVSAQAGSIASAAVNNLTSFSEFAVGILGNSISMWTGAANNGSWNDAANWDNTVPNASIQSVFPSGKSSYPATFPGTVQTEKIDVAPGVAIKLPYNLAPSQGIVNNGTIELYGGGTFNGIANLTGSGKLLFTSAGPAQINLTIPISQTIELNRSGSLTAAGSFGGNLVLTNGILNSNSFYLTNPSAIISYSQTAYIAGFLRRAVQSNGEYVFPISAGSYIAPVVVKFSNVTGPASILASFANVAGGAVPSLVADGQTVDRLLNNGAWTLTPNTPLTGGSYSVRLETSNYNNGVTDASRYIVLKRPNSSGAWILPGDNGRSTQTGGTNNGSGVISNGRVTATAGNITGFSDFAIGIASGTVPVALPVKLNGFTAKAVNENVTLNWQTSAEVNNDKFIIEKSRDGALFTAIGEVRGSGNSTVINNYSFKDDRAGSGVIYYRLKQVDRDGRTDYSEIRVVNITPDGSAAIKVFPNPFVETVYIAGMPGIVQFKLFTPAGQLLLDGFVQNNQVKLPAALNKGMYILQLKKKEEVKPYLYFLQK